MGHRVATRTSAPEAGGRTTQLLTDRLLAAPRPIRSRQLEIIADSDLDLAASLCVHLLNADERYQRCN